MPAFVDVSVALRASESIRAAAAVGATPVYAVERWAVAVLNTLVHIHLAYVTAPARSAPAREVGIRQCDTRAAI